MNNKRNTFFLWMMAGAIITLCAGLFGFTEIAQTQQHQKVASSSSNEAQPRLVCPMEWTSPASSSNAGEMPPTGAVAFDWTDHPSAHGYSLTVLTPNGSPVSYDVDGSSKDLFLENYDQVGDYQVIVTAFGVDNAALCSITMSFNLPVVSVGVKEKTDREGGETEHSDPSSVIPSNPVMPNPQPAEVEIH